MIDNSLVAFRKFQAFEQDARKLWDALGALWKRLDDSERPLDETARDELFRELSAAVEVAIKLKQIFDERRATATETHTAP
jgi:hypothetical protein